MLLVREVQVRSILNPENQIDQVKSKFEFQKSIRGGQIWIPVELTAPNLQKTIFILWTGILGVVLLGGVLLEFGDKRVKAV